jgi:tRNA A-37 threonylcarbamoyl transferase component Bud32
MDPLVSLRGCLRAWKLTPEAAAFSWVTKNHTTMARTRSGKRVLLKVAPNPYDPGVVREAEVLRALSTLEAARHLEPPHLYDFDSRRRVLALDWIGGAESLFAFTRRTKSLALPLLSNLGRAVGELHRESSLDPDRFSWATPRAETLLDCFLWTRPEFYARLPPDAAVLIGSVQAVPAAVKSLERLTKPVDVTPCLIHGDLKQPNVLLRKRSPTKPILLDWELAHWGDPAQDLGSLFSDIVRCEAGPEVERERLSRSQTARMLKAFRHAYQQARGQQPAEFWLRVRHWTAAHLIIYGYMIVLADGVYHRAPFKLVRRALTLLTEGGRG